MSAADKTENAKVVLNADNSIALRDYFEWETVAAVEAKAKELDSRLPDNKPLYFVINSGGGDVNAGLELIETLKHLNRPVVTVTIFAASMGFQTVQGLGTRYVQSNGTLMAHRARGGFSGEFPGQLDSRYGYWLKRINRLDAQAVARTNGKHTIESFHNLIANEYWCDGQDCVNDGFADAVVDARCDDSLKGTTNKVQHFEFFGKTIELRTVMDKCPLVTGVLSYEVYVNGKSLYTFIDNGESKTWNTDNKSFSEAEIKIIIDRVDNIISDKNNRTIRKSY
jgi:ATP-dependent protease ClpP protease subunit